MNGEDVSPEIQLAFALRFNATAEAIRAYAQLICPVDTGFLQSSIEKLSADADGCEIGTDCEYAWFVENGTCKMAAQPYLRPAPYAVSNEVQVIWSR